MFIKQLSPTDLAILLIKPDVQRDALLGVYWMADPHGRYTLKMMGVPDDRNCASILAEEVQRMNKFLEDDNQYNWMIQLDGRVIGTIWVDLLPTHGQQAPAISIMLGDPSVRGGGIGYTSSLAVIEFLRSIGHTQLYSRHLTENHTSEKLLSKLNFINDGEPYIDSEDGLQWQNVVLAIAP